MQKIILPSAEESARSALPNNDDNLEEYEENVAALKMKTKSPAAQTVQELLSATRDLRLKWLSSTPVSIHNILEKYPVLGYPKWVGQSAYIHITQIVSVILLLAHS